MESLALVEGTPGHAIIHRPSVNLWAQALGRLSDADKLHVDVHQQDKRTLLEDMLNVVEEKKRICDEKRWKYTTSSGQIVEVRKVLENVVSVVKQFRDVGDVVVQYDTAHAALPWAGVRLLLQIAISDSEVHGAMVEGIQLVSTLIDRYATVEKLYLRRGLALQDQLEQSIIELYVAILSFLSEARKFYERGAAGRFVRSIVHNPIVEKHLEAIRKKAQQVDNVAQIIDTDYTRNMGRFIYIGLNRLNERFEEMYKLPSLNLYAGSNRSEVARVGLEELLLWLDAVFTDEEWEQALYSRTSGTCRWILERPLFREWVSDSDATNETKSKFLWIHGPAGFGKTVLCASIVEYLHKEHHTNVAQFFCTSDDDTKRQPSAVVRSWVAQMVRQHPEALERAQEAYQGKEGRKATTSDIWALFQKICERIPNCVFVVDGFDECMQSPSNEALRFLRELTRLATEASWRLLLVSRDGADLQSQFRRLAESSHGVYFEYKISITDTQDDVKSFSTAVVAETLPKRPDELKEEIVTQASQRSQGMFLWVRLLGAQLKLGKNAKQLRKMVQQMPDGLEDAYNRDLQHILSLKEEKNRALSILRWALFALRPLTVRELMEALAVTVDDDSEDYPRDELPDAWTEDEVHDQIRQLCGSLIEFRARDEQQQPESQMVHFVHFSAREFLLRAEAINLPPLGTISFSHVGNENDSLSQICLQYLCYNELRATEVLNKEAIKRKTDDYGFLNYASTSWYIHARHSTNWSEELIQLTNKFFEPNASRWLLWSSIFENEAEEVCVQPEERSSLYYVSHLGFIHPLRWLHQQGVGHGKTGNLLRIALTAGAAQGHVHIVKFLMEHGAEVPAKNHGGDTALHQAASNGHTEVVKLLIEQGAQVQTQDQDEWTPLHMAAEEGHTELVQLLIEHDAQVQTPNRNGGTPLLLAAGNGHTEVVKVLIEHGAEVQTQAQHGLTALYMAAFNGHREVVQLLIEHGAEVQTQAQNGWTPLHMAAGNGYMEVVKVLIDQGAEVQTPNQDGLTALYMAAFNGHVEVAQLLIEHGAQVQTPNQDGVTPLYMAALGGHKEVVQLLIEHGAEVQTPDRNGWTPLHMAAGNGYMEVVQLLIEHGAQVRTQARNGGTALHWAAFNGHTEAVKVLIEQGAEVQTQDQDGMLDVFTR